MTLNCVYKQFLVVDFSKKVNVAVCQHCMGLWLSLDVLEDYVVVVNAEDEDSTVESLVALGKEGFVVLFECFDFHAVTIFQSVARKWSKNISI